MDSIFSAYLLPGNIYRMSQLILITILWSRWYVNLTLEMEKVSFRKVKWLVQDTAVYMALKNV